MLVGTHPNSATEDEIGRAEAYKVAVVFNVQVAPGGGAPAWVAGFQNNLI